MVSPYWKKRIEREHQERLDREKAKTQEDIYPMEDTFSAEKANSHQNKTESVLDDDLKESVPTGSGDTLTGNINKASLEGKDGN